MEGYGTSKKTYMDERPAEVISVTDPDNLMRVQVRIKGMFEGVPDSDLPWAEYRLPIGFRANEGAFVPVQVGDFVWVDFPYNGDTRRPRITGSMHFCPDNKPNMPHEAWEGPDQQTHERTSPQLTPTATQYHTDVVLSQNGILVEVIKSTGEIRVTQKATKSAIEIDKEGNITAHSAKNLYGSAVDCQLDIAGLLTINVDGACEINAGSNVNLVAEGAVTIDSDEILLGPNATEKVVLSNDPCPLGLTHVGTANIKGTQT